MSICGSADVNGKIFVMEASYRNVSCPGKTVTAVINSGRAVIVDPTCESAWPLTANRRRRLANGRDHEQIHGGNVRSVVSQKGLPPLTRRATSFHHVLGDG